MRTTFIALALALLAGPAFAEAPAPKPAAAPAAPAPKAAPDKTAPAPATPADKGAPAPTADQKPAKVGQNCPKEAEGTTQDGLTCQADKKGKFRWQKADATPTPPRPVPPT